MQRFLAMALFLLALTSVSAFAQIVLTDHGKSWPLLPTAPRGELRNPSAINSKKLGTTGTLETKRRQ